MIAFIPSLGWQEMFLLLVFGLLLYGRNLPEAGRNLGRVVAQLKRSFHDFKDQLDRDGEIRDVKKAIQDTAREVKNVGRVPHALSNPGAALRALTHEAMSSPLPDEPDAVEVAAQATLDQATLDQADLDQADMDASAHAVTAEPTTDATGPQQRPIDPASVTEPSASRSTNGSPVDHD